MTLPSTPVHRHRIAVVAGPDPGHAFPAFALAVALHEAGHRVVVCSGERWADAVRRSGPEFVCLPQLQADPRDADLGFRFWGRGREMAPALAELLSPYSPDLVVADAITVPGWFAADLLGVPRVELIATTLQDPSKHLPPPGCGLLPGTTPLGRLRDAWMRRTAAAAQAQGRAQCVEARLSLGLPAEGPPALRLVATLPALELPRPDWPADTHVVGPLVWEPNEPELPLPEGDRPLVLVADSSASGGRTRGLLDLAVDVLPRSGLRVVGTRLGGAPVRGPGVSVGPGSHSALLPHVGAVVLPGGMGLLGKALAAGRPLVVVPGPGDQRDNAVRIVALGAGVMVEPALLDAASLLAAIRRVLSTSSYADAAARVAASGAGLGPHRAVELVERVLPLTRASGGRSGAPGRRTR